jgi:hypothetical protein
MIQKYMLHPPNFTSVTIIQQLIKINRSIFHIKIPLNVPNSENSEEMKKRKEKNIL